jgi:predicted TIM-barrel fold metal-dependent hydrolase
VRHLVGIDNIMWSADYPHTDTTFPHSHQYLDEHFQGVPAQERYQIVCGNAARLYGLG